MSRIKPQAPLLVVPFRQFLQVSALRPYSPWNPKTPVSLESGQIGIVPRTARPAKRRSARPRFSLSIRPHGRHRLRSELRRYLIVLEPPTLALDQGKRPWQTPSLRFVLRRSANFTSPGAVRMPPSVPLNHCRAINLGAPREGDPSNVRRRRRSRAALFHCTMSHTSGSSILTRPDSPAL